MNSVANLTIYKNRNYHSGVELKILENCNIKPNLTGNTSSIRSFGEFSFLLQLFIS